MRQGPERSQGSALEIFLYLLSLFYAGAVGLRLFFFKLGLVRPKKLPCKVVSVGNLTVGGTGKTPMTIYVVQALRRLGYRTAVLTRGYKGARERSGGIVSDGERVLMGPNEAGDEPYLMACRLGGTPVLVGKNRFAGGKVAVESFGSDVVVLDDGFQHLYLERDLDLVLLDARRPLGNGHLVPRGVLREPIRQLARADAFVLTRCEPVGVCGGPDSRFRKLLDEKPVFCCRHVPDSLIERDPATGLPAPGPGLDAFKGCRVLAFSGIANNEDFRSTLESLGCDIVKFLVFADHHAYGEKDLSVIQEVATRARVDWTVTTEKDYVRIDALDARLDGLLALRIGIFFGEEEKAFQDYLARALADQGAGN